LHVNSTPSMTNKEKILKLFDANKTLSVKEIIATIDVSKQMAHIVLNQLIEKKIIEKLGRTPKTVYRVLDKNKIIDSKTTIQVNENQQSFLQKNFVLITPIGEFLEGLEGFSVWCKKRNLPLQKTIDEFEKTKKKYFSYYNDLQIIEGSQKLQKTYGKETFLDKIYYLDFYAIERFGKTRLGVILHYAKQGQNKYLMQKLIEEIKLSIHQIVKEYKPDAVCFVPPTIRRETQIMKFIQEHLNLSLPHIDIMKISGIIPVPQKSLNKLEDRIKNAETTFAITDTRKFNKVLLIDDAVESGATMNQIAEKLKSKKVANNVIGLGIVGSFKGFDVITDI